MMCLVVLLQAWLALSILLLKIYYMKDNELVMLILHRINLLSSLFATHLVVFCKTDKLDYEFLTAQSC